MHANYRFIVKSSGNYRAQATDADVHLDWSNILQILVSTQSQSVNCPICLANPVAPRMAKCGHIFCLPCLIRYLHSTDDMSPAPEKKPRWKKCPICWDCIYLSDSRPVRWFTGQEGKRPQEGEDVVLRLMMRRPGSTLALPRDGGKGLGKDEVIPWYFAAEVMDYARVMKGTEEYMMEQYDIEVKELQQQETEDELIFGEGAQWTQKAVFAISELRERLVGLGQPPVMPQQSHERRPRRPPIEFHDNVSEQNLQSHYAKSGQSLPRHLVGSQMAESGSSFNWSRTSMPVSLDGEIKAQRVNCKTSKPMIRSHSQPAVTEIDQPSQQRSEELPKHILQRSHDESPYYFYEALLHYYLSPLDIRILKAAFGDFVSFPTTILPRVERVSTGHIVDDELRRRAKYLAHLPHGCEVGFLECDWTDVVSAAILEGFAPEIERRRKKNREKEIREEKERVRAEKEEDDKRWASARRRRATPTQDIISEADFEPLPEASVADPTTASSSPPWSASRAPGGSSFASLASLSTSPATSKTVWGTRIAAPTSPAIPATLDELDASGDDGWLQDWERDLLKEEDLVAQVEATILENDKSKQGVTIANNKKKKGKKITLMSTNARRGA